MALQAKFKFKWLRTAMSLAVLLAAGLLLGGAEAGAVPRNGVGVYSGVVGHSIIQPLVRGGTREIVSAGVSAAVDAQFVWNDHWSVNPLLTFSYEEIIGGNITGGDVLANAGLLQLRYWESDGYVAAHFGIYKELIRARTRTFDTGDGGFGFAAGWEWPDGLLINVQYDWERVLSGERIQAFRVQLGYRWY